jgi:GNAT superfamily N-acetyltransferase
MSAFHVRQAVPEDGPRAAEVLARAYRGRADVFPEAAALSPERFDLLLQTGTDLLVAETEDAVEGVVRRWEEDGVAWLDLLAATRTGAGKALVQAVERSAQDRGCRTVRLETPDLYGLPDLFQRWGYSPVSRSAAGSHDVLTMEKRVPLLTVREQRRGDGPFIERLTGRDGWLFDQQPQPGWFVAADGERSVGLVWANDLGFGTGRIETPLLDPGYLGRGLEVWMVERTALWCETNGFHTLELALDETTKPHKRVLEEYGWHAEAGSDVLIRRPRHVESVD